jgi:threonyl-tRNA synthetase
MAAGLRVAADYRGAKLGAKVRDAQVDLIPYMFVVGEKDRDAGTVAVRDRLEGDLGSTPLDAAIAKLRAEIDAKTVRQVAERQPVAVADRDSQHEY